MNSTEILEIICPEVISVPMVYRLPSNPTKGRCGFLAISRVVGSGILDLSSDFSARDIMVLF